MNRTQTRPTRAHALLAFPKPGWLLLLCCLPLLLPACGSDEGGKSDTVDTTDQSGDVPTDNGDATDTDTTPDVPADTDIADVSDTSDSGDTPSDTVADVDMTSDTDMSMQTRPWSWCEGPEGYVGDPSWQQQQLVATDEALYCGLDNEAFIDWMTMEVQWQTAQNAKSQLWVAPGSYGLPVADGDYAFKLPFCIKFFDDGTQPEANGVGNLRVNTSTFGMTNYVNYIYTQPMRTFGGEDWEMTLYFGGEEPAAPGTAFTLDGTPFDPFGESGSFSGNWSACSPNCNQQMDWRVWDSCHFEGFAIHRHTIDFENGSVEFDLRYGVSAASTEPGQFIRAEGVLDGTNFASTDYWPLIYVPAHHHFTRNFMLQFDQPVGDACFIAGEQLEGFGMSTMASVKLFDCSFNLLESRKIDTIDYERIDPP